MRALGAGPLRTIRTQSPITSMSCHGTRLITGHTYPNTVRIWDLSDTAPPASVEPLVALSGPREYVSGVYGDGVKVVAASRDCCVRVFDTRHWHEQAVLSTKSAPADRPAVMRSAIRSLEVCDGRMAVGCSDWLARIYDFDI